MLRPPRDTPGLRFRLEGPQASSGSQQECKDDKRGFIVSQVGSPSSLFRAGDGDPEPEPTPTTVVIYANLRWEPTRAIC